MDEKSTFSLETKNHWKKGEVPFERPARLLNSLGEEVSVPSWATEAETAVGRFGRSGNSRFTPVGVKGNRLGFLATRKMVAKVGKMLFF